MKSDLSMYTNDIPLRVAQHVIDILNEGAELDCPEEEKVEFLLKSLQTLLKRETLSNLILLEDLARKPAPRFLKRYLYTPSPKHKPVFEEHEVQEGMDEIGPVLKLVVPHLLASPRVPVVIVCVEDAMQRDPEWVQNSFQPRMREYGYEDTMFAAWASCPDRAICMAITQNVGTPPFTDTDRKTMSLMLRAVAPFLDREIFHHAVPLAEFDLTERQRDVLLYLLTGDCEKEIARHIQRSVHTVHTFVKQLYEKFKVSSRGELMAQFIDESVSRTARMHVQAH